jgi:uncharacterized membrane protein
MNQVRLEFQGTSDAGLLLTLLAAVILVTLGWGLGQLLRRRFRYGLVCVASAMGPAGALPALLAGAVRDYRLGRGRSARTGVLAALGVVCLPALGLALLGLMVLVSLLGLGMGPVEAIGATPSALAGAMDFQAGGLWLLAVLAQIALAAGVFYCSVHASLGTRRLAPLLALRTTAILVLLLILFKPAVAMTRGDPAEKPYLTVLVDRSGSMGILDELGHPSRWQQALAKLRQEHPRMRRHFRLIYHHFSQVDRRLANFSDLLKLEPEARGAGGTDLAGPLRNASAAVPASRSAGILVLTDGADNLNALDRIHRAASQSAVPIYPVGIGSLEENPAAAAPGAQITSVDAPMQVVAGGAIKLQTALKLIGRQQRTSLLALLDEEGEALDEQEVYTDQPAAVLDLPLSYTPGARGAHREDDRISLRLRLGSPGAAPGQDAPAQTEIHMLLSHPRIRVLYLEGSIRPEYKFLRRQLDSDPNVDLMTLVRVTGSRFRVQGSLGGRTLESLPETPEDFALFDVLVLGDLDASFLTAEQKTQIARFVRSGGGLLMIGGTHTMGPGGYGGTPIEDVMPVVFGTRAIGQEGVAFLPQLTTAGTQHPIFEGIDGYFLGPGGVAPTRQPLLKELSGCARTLRAKAGTVLALHPRRRNEAGPLTVLAAQRTGSGRSAAFTADTTWRWLMQMRALGVQGPHGRFWGQMIRWLAGVDQAGRDEQPAVVGRLAPTASSYRIGDPIVLRCLARSAAGELSSQAVVTANLTLQGSQEPPRVVPLAWDEARRSWSTQFHPDRPGIWKVEFSARLDDQDLGSDILKAEVRAHQAEMDKTARRQDLLEDLARRSRGRTVELGGLDQVVDDLIEQARLRAGAGPETRWVRLYHFALLFGIFCAALTVEWVLRRRWQLH